MKIKILAISLLLVAAVLPARSYNRRGDISIQSSYILPVEKTNFNSSLTLPLAQ